MGCMTAPVCVVFWWRDIERNMVVRKKGERGKRGCTFGSQWHVMHCGSVKQTSALVLVFEQGHHTPLQGDSTVTAADGFECAPHVVLLLLLLLPGVCADEGA